jgi:chromosomal replication initiation ATPase DnaA
MTVNRVESKDLESMLSAIAAKHGVTVDELRSPRRHRPLPAIRAEFCRKAWALNKHSMPMIAWTIRRDHSSVSYLLGMTGRTPSWDRLPHRPEHSSPCIAAE